MEYNTNILVALELIQEIDEKILHKALDGSIINRLNVHVVHVIGIIGEQGMVPPDFLLEDLKEREDNAKKKIFELGSLFNIPMENRFVKVGNIKESMVDLIKNINAGLLVVGNHSRHGFDTWFHWNNTVNLLKNCDCDVFAVRV